EIGGPLEPKKGLAAQALEFLLLSIPGEIRVLRSNRLRVVVGEQRGKVIATWLSALEPRSESGVHARAPCSGKARIRNLTRECVLDHVLPLTGHPRARPTTNEIAILEHAQIGFRLD